MALPRPEHETSKIAKPVEALSAMRDDGRFFALDLLEKQHSVTTLPKGGRLRYRVAACRPRIGREWALPARST